MRISRFLALQKMKATNKKLSDHVTNKRARMVEKHYKEFHTLYAHFEEVHIKYAAEASIPLDDPAMQELFTEASNLVDLADTTYENYKEMSESRALAVAEKRKEEAALQDRQARRRNCVLRYQTEMESIMMSLKEFVDDIKDGNEVNEVALKEEILHFEKKYEDLRAGYDELLLLSDEDEQRVLVEERAVKDREFRRDLFVLRSAAGGTTATTGSDNSSTRMDRETTPQSDSSSTVVSSLKTRKLDFPQFSGNMREYSTFKRDFVSIVEEPGTFDKKYMSHIMRNQCLSGEAKAVVHNVIDYDALWEKLEEKFNDESEVIEQITRQISGLKHLEDGDYAGLVKLVDVVERANMDLNALGNSSVLNNPMTVRLVMNRCSRSVREEIAEELNGKKTAEEFDVMLKLLVKKRKNAQRLARLAAGGEVRQKQSLKKGNVHASTGQHGDPGGGGAHDTGGGARGWACVTPGCSYKSKHFLSECRSFKKLQLNEKGKLVKERNLCVLCFGVHAVDQCPKKSAGWRKCDVANCGRWHSRLLHGATVPGLVLFSHSEKSEKMSDSTVLLMVQAIPMTSGRNVITLWDSGSDTSLITFSFARAANLEGVPCTLDLTGVGDRAESIKTKMFTVPLTDKNGQTRVVHAFGIRKITANLTPVEMKAAAEMLEVMEDEVQRPTGAVELLIGMENADVMPVRCRAAGSLVLFASEFGSGYVVGGKYPGQKKQTEIVHFAKKVTHAEGRAVKLVDFWSAEAFGIDIPRRCRNCKGCEECSFRAGQLSWQEAKELTRIEEGLSLDVKEKVWTATYPFHTDPAVMQDNFGQAKACMRSLEKRLKNKRKLEEFNVQFKDCLERGVFEEINKEVASSYEGPINYVTMTEAYKEGDGVTTPLRICMNSSMKYRGVSLNDLLMKGPSSLNCIYSVLLNFRSYQIGMLKDVSKFYNSIQASERDQHLRRILWRFGDEGEEPKIFISKKVNFGDKPSGCIALTAKRGTADLYSNINADAAQKLKDDNYVDDIATGADNREDALKLSRDMDEIMKLGGFRFKDLVMSGDKGKTVKVLGTNWDAERDVLSLDVKVNPSVKVKGVRKEPNIDLDHMMAEFPEKLTKRIVWRVVLGQFDLLGLASVFFIRLKLLMRDLSGEDGQKIGWDDELEDVVRQRFVTLLSYLKEVKNLNFPRSIKPENVDKDYLPDLICFGDGSKQAFCSLAYVRWKLLDGSFTCFLLTGKARVAPLRKLSVPRIELMGAVAAVRLAESVQKSMKIKFGKRYFLTDSSAVLGMITGDCSAFKEFVGTRTGEIKNKSEVEEWFWVPTKENMADLGTRDDVVPEMMMPKSAYLCGSEWMNKDESSWPLTKDVGQVPDEELSAGAKVVLSAQTTQFLLKFDRIRTFEKAKRVLARVFTYLALKKMLNVEGKGGNMMDFVMDAENYLLEEAQKSLWEEFKKGGLSALRPRIVNVKMLNHDVRIIVTSGRLGKALVIGYDKENLPVIPYKSKIAELIMRESHEIEHCGTDRTLFRSRTVAWIIQGRRLAERIRVNCFKCRLRAKYLQRQIMAPVAETRLPPAPVFCTTAVDLFGPIEIRDTVKRRVKKKTWGVIFCCTVTSAVYLDVTEDYSCDSFLLTLRRFCNYWGTPHKIISDPGSQLIAAAKELGKWDFSQIHEWMTGEKTEWKFIPANSQHFNGCAEAMIKITKKQMEDVLAGKFFTKGELDTVFSDVFHTVNSRPLMKGAGQDPLSGGPITPLHLMNNRCTKEIPRIPMDYNPTVTKRLQFIDETTNEFWRKWFVQVFQNLVPSYKWRKEFRNVMKGDIVLVKDSNLLKRTYRMARVKEVFPGEDGKVRRVLLEYKNLPEAENQMKNVKRDLKNAKFTEIERAIQNIVVIVPADWSDSEIEKAVTQDLRMKCDF